MRTWIPSKLFIGWPVHADLGQDYDPDFLTRALSPDPPRYWEDREERVRWVRANLTPGEQAMLYRIAYEADGLRIEKCRAIERAEKDQCK